MTDAVKEKFLRSLRAATASRSLSHAVILSGAGDRATASRYIAAAHVCQSDGSRPCLICNACHKALNDIHPDVITVNDPEHKEISVDIIRDLCQDAYVLPNEAPSKVYIFPDCRLVNERDQNVLLKVVEDGPLYASFVLCTETLSCLLPTIRSRCVELRLPAAQENGDGNHPLTEPFFKAICSGKDAVTTFCIEQESRKMKREDLDAFFRHAYTFPAEALLVSSGKPDTSSSPIVSMLSHSFNRRQLNDLTEFLRYYRDEFQYNVGVGLVWGALCAGLHNFYE